MKDPHKLRAIVALICLVAGVIILAILNLLLDGEGARILLDKREVVGNKGGVNVFAIQHFIWLAFFVGSGELWLRFQWSRDEEQELRQGYLGGDADQILSSKDLGEAYRKLRRAPAHLFLPRLLRRTIAQFQANKSIEQANTLLNSSLDLFMHEIDLRYNMLRYIVWFIPTMGFIGTVMGISKALQTAGSSNPESPDLLKLTTGDLAVAFHTTFLALILSGILVFIMHLVEGKEEGALNEGGQFCLDNLINRLYVKR